MSRAVKVWFDDGDDEGYGAVDAKHDVPSKAAEEFARDAFDRDYFEKVRIYVRSDDGSLDRFDVRVQQVVEFTVKQVPGWR